MISQENASGKPLADAIWLEKHHIAKLKERIGFAEKLKKVCPAPKRIVDLGCATGLWLDLLNTIFPDYCEFIGIDSDRDSLAFAESRSKSWSRKTSFIQLDLNKEVDKIPTADVTLAFNIFPYIDNIDTLLFALSARKPRGLLAVRQYDGASIRFGPMPTDKRQNLETSLRIATDNSSRFRHYDMDRAYMAIRTAPYKKCDCYFELFERTYPFTEDFIPYYEEMLRWTCDHVSDSLSSYLSEWLEDSDIKHRYFYEVDLCALLS